MKIDRMKIGQLFNIEKGTLQSSKNTPGKYDFITASSDWKTHNEYTHDCEALIFAMGASGSLGRTHYANGKFIASDLCFVLTPKEEYKYSIDLRFYYHYFNSLREEIVKNTATGTSKLAINITNFSNYEIDYYPIEVQRNISRKIDLVIPKINLLEHQIKNTLADINQLKQSILQQAVQGKLVEQDPNDEPAAELLKRIREEKERLIKEKKIKKEKPLPPISPEEIPYELPKGWEWVRLGEIVYSEGGKTPSKANKEYWDKGDILWVSPKDMKTPYIIDSEDKITSIALQETSIPLVPVGSLLIVVRSGILKRTIPLAIVKKECTINQDIKAINSSVLEVNQFLYWYIKAYEKELLIKFAKTGTTVDRIVFEDFLKCIIPLPPLNVIKKINEKIHLLMKLYDQLNEEIEKSNQNLKLLTESVLKEAFQD